MDHRPSREKSSSDLNSLRAGGHGGPPLHLRPGNLISPELIGRVATEGQPYILRPGNLISPELIARVATEGHPYIYGKGDLIHRS